jgi:hypothetical protein
MTWSPDSAYGALAAYEADLLFRYVHLIVNAASDVSSPIFLPEIS